MRDRDYIVQDGVIIIIDKVSARMVPGRRYDEGLHQALEAKEGCAIGEETRTLASITLQTFFRRYDKLAGMTGTAIGDVEEYRQVYGLDVAVIPTHRPLIRRDETFLHSTRDRKLLAILDEVERARVKQQPVLISASSIDDSEAIAAFLEANGWTRDDDTAENRKFTLLNARHHASEARTIALAGLPGAVTVATAMAGRGTDIRLGGPGNDTALRERVVAAGGLLVIGTEHHEHRRIDTQLRGRAGRQGDPGRSVFHASLEDDLLSNDRLPGTAIGDAPIDPSISGRFVVSAQRRSEARSFDRRMNLLRFEAVIERQREAIYGKRIAVRDDPDPMAHVHNLRNDTIDDLMERFAPGEGVWDTANLDAMVRSILTIVVPITTPSGSQQVHSALLRKRIGAVADDWMQGKVDAVGRDTIKDVLRRLMMAVLDQLWAEQLERLEHLKRAIEVKRLAPHKVLAEFEVEAFALFEIMMKEFRHEVTAHAMRLGKRPLIAGKAHDELPVPPKA